MLRDGDHCPLTKVSFFPPHPMLARCAYIFYPLKGNIIPWMTFSSIIYFSRHKHMLRLKCLQALCWMLKLYRIKNALNLQSDAHDSMDKHPA